MEELLDWLNEWEKLMDEKSKKLDEAKRKMNIIDHGWKKIDIPEWLEEWSTLTDYETIKKAIKENKVYNIDRLFWNDGKLLGHDGYYIQLGDGKEIGPFFNISKDGVEYRIQFKFDWERCILLLTCHDFNKYIVEPVHAQVTITFDQLFGVNPGVVQALVLAHVIRLIETIDRLKNDGKKDNRDC